MKNSKLRRALLLLACAVMLVSLSVGATLAYLTVETDTVTNYFTIGNVSFDDPDDEDSDDLEEAIDEAKTDEYGVPVEDADRVTTNTYKLVPSQKYTKDPTVHIGSTSEEAWLFVKIENGIADIEIKDDPETEANEAAATINNQMVLGETAKWVKVGEGIYAYKTKVKANDDILIFSSFTIDGSVETGKSTDEGADPNKLYLGDYTSATITIQAYLVQADGLDTYALAWEAAPCPTW